MIFEKQYVVLDDDSIKNGGTSLTLFGILEKKYELCEFINHANFSKDIISLNKDKLWIIGNIHSFLKTEEKIDLLIDVLDSLKFVKIEFDYNFCPFRGEVSHKHLHGSNCECPHGLNSNSALSVIYDLICKKAKHIYFMSEKQRAVYSNHLPIFRFYKSSILSSCFSEKTFSLLNQLKNNEKNQKYAILSGYGGWHSKAKGLEEAKNFCEANKLEYDILPNQPHENHLVTLSHYHGLVFMPIIQDTCPRCTIEARLLGLKTILNLNCQHITEEWWQNEDQTEKYLMSRPKEFWKIIESI